MEQLPEFPHDDTEMVLRLASDESITCTKYNTALYFYKGQYEPFSHVYHIRENNQPLYLFNSERVMKRLKDLGYDTFRSTVAPSETDQKIFFSWAAEKLMSGITEYLEDK